MKRGSRAQLTATAALAVAAVGAVGAVGAQAAAAASLQWTRPLTVTRDKGARGHVSAAVNGSGLAALAWNDGGGCRCVRVRMQSANGRLGVVQIASRRHVRTDGDPAVAVNSQGKAIVVWREARSSNPEASQRVMASVRSAGGRFGKPRSIGRSDAASDYGESPAVAMDARGNALAAWVFHAKPGNRGRLIGYSYRAHRHSFGRQRALRGGALGLAAQALALAFDPRGTAYLAWGRGGTYVAWRPAGRNARFRHEVELSPSGEPGSKPQVAIGSDRTVAVVWRASHVPTGTQDLDGPIEAAIRSPGSRSHFGAAQTLSRPVCNAAGQCHDFSDQPGAVVTPAGEVIAAWSAEVDPEPSVVAGAVRPAGGAFGAPFAISGAGGARGSLVPTGQGQAVAVWEQDGNHLLAAARPPGGAFGATGAASPAGVQAFFPRAVGGRRRVVVLYISRGFERLVSGTLVP